MRNLSAINEDQDLATKKYVDETAAPKIINSSQPNDVTIAILQDNTEYYFTGQITSLTITAVPSGKYEAYISIDGSVYAPTFNFPASIKWAGGNAPTIKSNKKYEISIKNNLALIAEY